MPKLDISRNPTFQMGRGLTKERMKLEKDRFPIAAEMKNQDDGWAPPRALGVGMRVLSGMRPLPDTNVLLAGTRACLLSWTL